MGECICGVITNRDYFHDKDCPIFKRWREKQEGENMRKKDYIVVSMEVIVSKDEVDSVCSDLLRIAENESHLFYASIGKERKVTDEEWKFYKSNYGGGI